MHDLMTRAMATGTGLGQAEKRSPAHPVPAIRSVLPIISIKPRAHTGTRQLAYEHVLAIAESIAVLGLIEPLVVDKHHRLLAGEHRLAALRFLQMPSYERVNRWSEVMTTAAAPDGLHEQLEALVEIRSDIAVHILDFDSETDANRALAVEVAENEQRRQYSSKEVKLMAERFKLAGFRSGMGRPKNGERPMMDALEAVVGKSRRTIMRMLEAAPGGDATAQAPKAIDHNKRLVHAMKNWLKYCDAHPLREQVELIMSELHAGNTA